MKNILVILFLIVIFETRGHNANEPGLIAYYPFNGNANDESGNGNDGVVTGATLTKDRLGNLNSAYSFDGKDDFINIGHNPSLKRSNISFSICAWVNLNSYSSSYSSVIISNRSRTDNGFIEGSIVGVQGKLQKPGIFGFTSQGGAQSVNVASGISIPLNSWNHLVITFEFKGGANNLVKLYLNGVLTKSEAMMSFIESPNADTYIGFEPLAGTPATYHFKGLLDDIKVYNRVITEKEVIGIYRKDSDLIAHYPFDGNAEDFSIYKNNGVVKGPTPTNDRNGNLNSAYKFDGVDDIITVGDIHDDVFAGNNKAFSFSFWFKHSVVDNRYVQIITKMSACGENQRQFGIGLRPDKKMRFFWTNTLQWDYRIVNGSTVVADTTKWYHVLITYDGNTAYHYFKQRT